MINSRQKGHAFELWFCKRLRELGFEAVTSRSESRRLDALKVDTVDNTPYYWQLKRLEKLGQVDTLLQSMPDNKPRVVLSKRSHKPAVVHMLYEDFEAILLGQKKLG
jgi:hypothetical protein